MWQTLIQQLSDTLMFEFNPVEKEKISGGDISDCYMISDGEQRYFVKVNTRDFLAKFEIEGENLRSLRETSTVQVPELVMIGTSKNDAFIVLNYLPTKPLDNATNSYEFGVQLAKLHQWGEQKEYGFDTDNYIGSTLQPNPWDKKWCHFFAEQRIGWQLQLLREKGIELFNISELVDVVQSRLANHSPRPSLLHGDLWHGNMWQTLYLVQFATILLVIGVIVNAISQ